MELTGITAAPAAKRTDDPCAGKRLAGRPRSDATRGAILRAAYELLSEGGLRNFTIEGVAARSGVARTTIYRWWPSRGALAMDGFLETTAPHITFPHTQSATADLRVQMRLCAKLLRGPAGRILCGIIAEGQNDPETIAVFSERYLTSRRREAAAILQRGIDTGEFRPHLDIQATQSAIYSSLHLRLLLREPIDDSWVERLADSVLRGCVATS
ncbi:MAG TPA: TetR/AcrR family transcriptional regulator [Acetobacteraceae bacterium]|jgi:AcrR family transcriptional regulator